MYIVPKLYCTKTQTPTISETIKQHSFLTNNIVNNTHNIANNTNNIKTILFVRKKITMLAQYCRHKS